MFIRVSGSNMRLWLLQQGQSQKVLFRKSVVTLILLVIDLTLWTDYSDIVDMSFGLPLDRSDHCFVSCGLYAKLVVPENITMLIVQLKQQRNCDNICNVRSCSSCTVVHSPDFTDLH